MKKQISTSIQLMELSMLSCSDNQWLPCWIIWPLYWNLLKDVGRYGGYLEIYWNLIKMGAISSFVPTKSNSIGRQDRRGNSTLQVEFRAILPLTGAYSPDGSTLITAREIQNKHKGKDKNAKQEEKIKRLFE